MFGLLQVQVSVDLKGVSPGQSVRHPCLRVLFMH